MFQRLQLISPLPHKLVVILIIIAGIGFIDATYLTVEHFLGTVPPCSIEGCQTVLTSKYSEIAGIPIALGGAVYYFLILLSLFIYKDTKKDKIILFSFALVSLGFIVSISLVSIMLFVLKAICLYCIGSAITTTVLFFTLLFCLKKRLQI